MNDQFDEIPLHIAAKYVSHFSFDSFDHDTLLYVSSGWDRGGLQHC